MIFFFFKPLHIKKKDYHNVPLFNVSKFSMYELDSYGLLTLMTGNRSLKYADRYTVEGIDFTDNSKDFIANMKADHGLYKDDIVTLNGNVAYYREDGLAFESPTLVYNRKSSIATTKDPYIAYMGTNSMRGSSLEYNVNDNKIKSKNVEIKYKLGEKK